MVYFLQLLIAFAVGSLCIYAGVENGYLIAVYIFIATYGLTVWGPDLFIGWCKRRADRRIDRYQPPDIRT